MDTIIYIQILIIVILIGLIVFIIFYNKRESRKVVKLLESKNLELVQKSKHIQENRDKINSLYKQLQMMSEFKEGVVNLLVHDLKNPLNLIVNQELFSPEMVKYAASQMMIIISNILDVQNDVEDPLYAAKKPCELGPVIRNAFQQVEYSVTQKRIKFTNEIKDQVSIIGDKNVLIRVFVNLFINAIKYTPDDGFLTVTSEQYNGKLKISCIDNGSQVPKDLYNLVFDKFGLVVAKKSDAPRAGNIGLHYCKLALEAHGSEIYVDSNSERTIFWFELEVPSVDDEKPHSDLKFELNIDEKIQLEHIISLLKDKQVYEISEVRRILKLADEIDDPKIQEWKEQMLSAINSGDEELFGYLVTI